MENGQNEIKILSNKLRNYNPTKLKRIKTKEETLNASEKLISNRQEVIHAFKTSILLHEDVLQKKKNQKKNQKNQKKKS